MCQVLPKKTRRAGWDIRRVLLESAGIVFGPSLADGNHDQLDACLAAVVAAATEGPAGPGNVPLSVADRGEAIAHRFPDGPVVCRERFGGLLKHYDRAAA